MAEKHDPLYGTAQPRELAIDEGSSSQNAYCISSYGAIMLLSECSASQVQEILCDTPPEDLRKMSHMLLEHIEDRTGEPHDVSEAEGTIKDYAYKARLLQSMAQYAEENSEVVDQRATDNNRYEPEKLD